VTGTKYPPPPLESAVFFSGPLNPPESTHKTDTPLCHPAPTVCKFARHSTPRHPFQGRPLLFIGTSSMGPFLSLVGVQDCTLCLIQLFRQEPRLRAFKLLHGSMILSFGICHTLTPHPPTASEPPLSLPGF